jgi:hypothetical protein
MRIRYAMSCCRPRLRSNRNVLVGRGVLSILARYAANSGVAASFLRYGCSSTSSSGSYAKGNFSALGSRKKSNGL